MSGGRQGTYEIMRAAKDVPCMDCGQRYPHWIMQFDHRPEFVKAGEVGTLAARAPRWAVLEEMSHCDVVCANCHCRRTWERQHESPL